jgi:hypothetical protein
MSNISSNSRRRVRALIESRPKAGSSVSSGTSCPSGTRTRYLLKMVSNCAFITRCTSFSDGVVAARSAVKRYKLTNPSQGCYYSEHGVLASRRVSGGSRAVDRIRAVARTMHLHLGRESWRTVVPLSSANARIWHRRPGVSKVFSTAFGASVVSITRRTGPYPSVWKVGRLFNHICTRTSRATRCGSGGRTTIQGLSEGFQTPKFLLRPGG